MIKFSINRKVKNKSKPTDESGNLLTKNWEAVEGNHQVLAEHILSGFALCNSQLKSTHKNIDNFLIANTIWLDFDNCTKNSKGQIIKSEPYVDLYKVVANQQIKDNAYLIYTTPSHTPEWHKFRIIFKLPEEISDANEYKNLITKFINYFHSDPAPSSICNAFYGNTNAEIFTFGATIRQDFLQKVLNYTDKVKAEKQQFNGKAYIPSDEIAKMLAVIPRLDYLEWSKICHGVHHATGFNTDEAVKLLENWLPCERRNELPAKLKNPMRDITTGTLLYYAKEFGYQVPDSIYKPEVSDVVVDDSGRKSENKKSTNYDIVQLWLDSNFSFKHNIVTGKYEILKDDIYVDFEDSDLNEIWRQLNLANIKVTRDNLRAIIESHYTKSYNPFKEYFDSLPPWETDVDYVELLVMKFMEFEDITKSMKFIKHFVPYLVGVYRQAYYNISNHSIFVLHGKQGCGKTKFWRWICPPAFNPKYFCETAIKPGDKDSEILITNKFLINLDEIEGSTKNDHSHLKSLVTKDALTGYRRPYGHFSTDLPRYASFCGTVNIINFLRDDTGGRRFLAHTIERFKADKIDFTSDLLWSQIKKYADTGMKSFVEFEDIEALEEHNQQYKLISPEEELLIEYFEPAENDDYGISKMSATEILVYLQDDTKLKLSPVRLGILLAQLGFKRIHRREGDKIARCWLVKKLKVNNHL
jgi:hypothetical protein